MAKVFKGGIKGTMNLAVRKHMSDEKKSHQRKEGLLHDPLSYANSRQDSEISFRIIAVENEKEINGLIENRQALLGKLLEKLNPVDSFAEQLLRSHSSYLHISKFIVVLIRRIADMLVDLDNGRRIGDNYHSGMFYDSIWKYELYWFSTVTTGDGRIRHTLNCWSISNCSRCQLDDASISVLIVDRQLEIDETQCINSNIFDENAISSSVKTSLAQLLEGLIADSEESLKVFDATHEGPYELSSDLMENFEFKLLDGKMVATSIYNFGPLEGIHDIVMMHEEMTGDPYFAYVVRYSSICVFNVIWLKRSDSMFRIPSGVTAMGWTFLPEGHEKKSTKEMIDLIRECNSNWL